MKQPVEFAGAVERKQIVAAANVASADENLGNGTSPAARHHLVPP